MRVPLKLRCNESWEAMEGEGSIRTCARCERRVTDLSALTEREAKQILAADPSTCVRYKADAAGHVVFRRSRLARVAAAALALLGASSASAAETGDPRAPVLVTLSSVPRALAEPGAAQPGELILEVLDDLDLPVPGAQVELTGPRGESIVRTTDASGVVFVQLPSWGHRAQISHPSLGAVTLDGIDPARATSTVVRLPGFEELMGVIVGEPSLDEQLKAAQREREAKRQAEHLRRVAERKKLWAVLRVVTEPNRLRKAVVRCAGAVYEVLDLSSGEDELSGLPEGRDCTLRVDGDPDAVVEFVAGTDGTVEAEVTPKRSRER